MVAVVEMGEIVSRRMTVHGRQQSLLRNGLNLWWRCWGASAAEGGSGHTRIDIQWHVRLTNAHTQSRRSWFTSSYLDMAVHSCGCLRLKLHSRQKDWAAAAAAAAATKQNR
jgi:hypothetical protein